MRPARRQQSHARCRKRPPVSPLSPGPPRLSLPVNPLSHPRTTPDQSDEARAALEPRRSEDDATARHDPCQERADKPRARNITELEAVDAMKNREWSPE